MDKVKKFSDVTKPLKRRGPSGAFGAYRSAHPTIPHQGQDFLVSPGAEVYAPIGGKIRIARPYANDPRFSGVEISGTGKESMYKVKVFYIDPVVIGGQTVKAGELVGYAQNLGIKYSASTPNHVHVEVRKYGVAGDPSPYFEKDTVLIV